MWGKVANKLDNARVFGVSPTQAVAKLAGDQSADAIAQLDNVKVGMPVSSGGPLGLRVGGPVISGDDAYARGGSKYEPSTSGGGGFREGDGEAAPGVPMFNRDGMATGADPAAQAAAQRQAELRAQADPIHQALAALDTEKANQLRGNQETYDQRLREYNDRFDRDRSNWEENVSTNEGGLQSQRQNKMLSGARLSQGLNSILASMGALNGTGQFLANQAVEGITNRGLGESTETFEANARNINSAWEQAEQEDRNRRERADNILKDQNAATNRDILTSRQNMLNQLGNLYGSDTSEGRGYLADAGALYGQIAGTSRPNVAQYQEASSLYSPEALDSYLSGIGNTQVTSESRGSGGGVPVNSPLFAGTRRRRDEQLA